MAQNDAFGADDDLSFSGEHEHGFGDEPLQDAQVIEAQPAAGDLEPEDIPPRKKRSFVSRVLPLVGLVVLVGGVSAFIVPKALHMHAGSASQNAPHGFNPSALSHVAAAKQPMQQASALLPGSSQAPRAASGGFAVPPSPAAPRAAGSAPQSFLAPAAPAAAFAQTSPQPQPVSAGAATISTEASAAPSPSAVMPHIAQAGQDAPASSADQSDVDAQLARLSARVSALDDRVAQMSAQIKGLVLMRARTDRTGPAAARDAHAAALARQRAHWEWVRAHEHPRAAPAAPLRDYSVKATYPGAGKDVRAWISGPHGLVESVGVGSDVGGARVLRIDAQDLRVETTRGVIVAAGLR